MTHDLVERLRNYGLTLEESVVICDRRAVDEAADLIESLRADLAEQKAAHGDCIKRNIALTAEIAALRAERSILIEEAAQIAKNFGTGTRTGEAIAAAIRSMGERE